MRPNVELTRDPLRPELMPPTEGMELDYRTRSGPSHACRSEAVYALVQLGVLGFVLTLALRAFGAYLSTFWFLFPAVLITGAVALYQFLNHEPPWRWGKWLLAGPLVWLLSNVSTPAWQGALLLVTLLAASITAHRVIVHYAYWLRAHPYLDREPRMAWEAAWEPLRFWRHPSRITELWWPEETASAQETECAALRQAEQEELQAYGRGVPIIGLLYMLTMLWLGLDTRSLAPGLGAYVIFLALLLAHGFWQLRTVADTVSPWQSLRIVGAAIVSWLTYNTHATKAPGVFRSPCGGASLRRTEFYLVGLLIALTILPLAAYFPIGMQAFGAERWLRATDAPWPWEDTFQRRHARTPQQPVQPVLDPQVPAGYLDQLSPGQRAAYQQAYATLAADRQREAKGVAYLTASPEATLLVCVRGAFGGDATFVGALALAILAALIAPTATLFCLLFGMGARTLTHFYTSLEQGPEGQAASYHSAYRGSAWEAYVRRLRSSDFRTRDECGRETRERDLLLIGFSLHGDYPILLERGILSEHGHIMGDSGSGKSSLGIAPLIAQLIGRPDTSVVVLDLKGDRALFEAARCGVRDANESRRKKRRIRFRWFTNAAQLSTFAFNPFLQKHMLRVTLQQKASILLQSLGLEYGEGYGRSYFSAIHRSILTKILQDDPNILSFRRLQAYFDRDLRTRLRDMNIDRKVYQDASHLFSVVDSLASFDALNVTPESQVDPAVLRQHIDMAQVVTQPSVAYFYLTSALEEQSVREIAKLALHSLLTAAVERGPSRHKVYLFIDEFQQVVSADLEIVLRQARSLGISMILANHTIADLRKDSVDLIPTVQTNTRFKQVFAASDLEQQTRLVQASGETLYELYGGSSSSQGITTSTWQEHLGPRLRINDIIETTDRTLLSLVHVTRGQGITQFGGFMLQAVCPYHITLEEYDRRSGASWPEPRPGTIIARPDTSVIDQHEIDCQADAQRRVLSELEQRLDTME